jgi:hypothetical protein
VKYGLDNTFEAQGNIKRGADLMIVTKTAKKKLKILQ